MPRTENLNFKDPLAGQVDATLPLIDLAALRRRDWRTLVPAAQTACLEHGFLYLQLDDSGENVLTDILAELQAFFAMDDAQKSVAGTESDDYGFTPSYGEPAYQPGTVANVESFDVVLENIQRPETLPDRHEFRSAVRSCWQEYLRIADQVLELIARAAGIAPHFLVENCSTRELNTMRLLNYPPDDKAAGENDVGIAAHSDFECITLLYQSAPGLELRTVSGEWRDAPAAKGRLIVLLDDMLEVWTNGHFQATGHRVRRSKEPRQSIVMFIAANAGLTIEPLPQFVGDDNPLRFAAVEQKDHIAQEMERARRNAAAARPG